MCLKIKIIKVINFGKKLKQHLKLIYDLYFTVNKIIHLNFIMSIKILLNLIYLLIKIF